MPDELLVLQDLAIKKPSYSQFASAIQKQQEGQLTAEPLFKETSLETDNPPAPSAFSAFKTRLETNQEKIEQAKEDSLPSSKTPLLSSNIRK